MKAKRLCAVAAAALAVGFTACGDDDEDSASTGTETQAEQTAPAGPAAETIKLSESEYKIDPAKVSVKKAGVVEFQVENTGATTHALEVEGGDVEEETEDIAPGESATLKVDLEKGAYDLYCPIDDHKEKGMTGELRVAGATGPAEDSGDDESEDDDSSSSGY